MPDLRWRLVTINTFGTWLHGDPRGFRSRHHRIHSSGDYRNPPPSGEHLGLFQYMMLHSRNAVRLPPALRPVIGRALVDHLSPNYLLLAISVASDHAHLHIKLPDDIAVMKQIIGDAKRRASRAVKQDLPGTVWSAGANFQPLDDRKHWENAIRYVLFRQGAGVWTWASERVREVGIHPGGTH
jgi:hypothetical protein